MDFFLHSMTTSRNVLVEPCNYFAEIEEIKNDEKSPTNITLIIIIAHSVLNNND